MDLPVSRAIRHAHHTAESVTLSYEDRFLRRKVLLTDGGRRFLVDLEHTTSVNIGDAFELDAGRLISVRAASEKLLEITGPVFKKPNICLAMTLRGLTARSMPSLPTTAA